jgi:MFS family permease
MQISLLTTFSQIAGLIFLIPGAVLTDRLSNKRRMVIISLSLLAVSYLFIGFVPAFGAYRFPAFLILLSVSVCPMTVYNTSWQAYFSDVITVENRNRVLSKRTAGTFLAGIAVSIITGLLLASAADTEAKIMIHQVFFWIAGILLLLQIFVLTRISSANSGAQTFIRLNDLIKSISGLFKSRKFLGFFGVALFFYLTWQIDWTLYFLGQVRYLGMNEAWLSYAGIGGTLVQFLSVGFWSRVNEKRGVRFGIIPGGLCLIGCPLAMIISTSVPISMGPTIFLILSTICNLTFATIPLNILQCLLQVIPEKNKTLSISIYTAFISLSNAFMPMLGVKLYTALGADLNAFQFSYAIICVFRIISMGLWLLRWRLLRSEPN